MKVASVHQQTSIDVTVNNASGFEPSIRPLEVRALFVSCGLRRLRIETGPTPLVDSPHSCWHET